jgi:hypothetical protein
MKLLKLFKEKIMPRPKGSKNKSITEVDVAPREFDYERDDVMIDNSYQTIERTTVKNDQPAWTLSTQDAALLVPLSEPLPSPILTSPNRDGTSMKSKLYLVEGEVQMSPRESGRGSVVAKQFRLVQAIHETEAVEKYSNYFSGLSDREAVYSTLRAAAMETIS